MRHSKGKRVGYIRPTKSAGFKKRTKRRVPSYTDSQDPPPSSNPSLPLKLSGR
jgi:hypothetical protein